MASSAAFAPWTVDDAFVVARYATRLVDGLGLTFRDGPPTDGVTAPLWLFLAAGARWVGWPVVGALKVVGALATAVAVGAVVKEAAGRAGGRVAAPVTAAVCVVQAPLGIAGTGGLSVGLAALLGTVAVLSATRRPRPNGVRVGGMVALLAWLRPELAPFAAVLLGITGWRSPAEGRRAGALAVLGLGSVLAYRAALFGHLLPMALSAKPATLPHGWRYLADGALVTTGGLGIAGLVLAARLGRGTDAALVVAVAVHGVAVVLAGGDWMPGFRLLAPVLPVAALLVGIGLSRGWLAVSGASPWRRRFGRAGLVLVLVAAVGVPAAGWVAAWPAAMEGARARRSGGAAVANHLARDGRRVALVDVGFLAYRSGVPDVVDLGGITDPEIASLPGGHLDKRIPEALLVDRAPDTLILHSEIPPVVDARGRLARFAGHPVERRVAGMAWVRDRFRVTAVVPYSGPRTYVVLRRSEGDDGRPRDER